MKIDAKLGLDVVIVGKSGQARIISAKSGLEMTIDGKFDLRKVVYWQ